MIGSAYANGGKRCFDLALAVASLSILGPLMLLIAAAVAADSRGPVFYRQARIGRDGRVFRIFKFRSMIVGAEFMGSGIRVEPADSRITRVGRFLRRTSLDEVAQVINVILGDMSFIGPRPGLRYQVEQYDLNQRRRLLVRPGITGWAQINGRNSIDWERRIQLDLEYLDRISLRTDLLILFRTVPTVLRGRGMISDIDYWKMKAARASRDAGADGGPEQPSGQAAPTEGAARVE